MGLGTGWRSQYKTYWLRQLYTGSVLAKPKPLVAKPRAIVPPPNGEGASPEVVKLAHLRFTSHYNEGYIVNMDLRIGYRKGGGSTHNT